MKVLHILDHSLPLQSGYSFRSLSILSAQRSRGWYPVVVTSPKHEASWKGSWCPEEVIDGIRYYRCGGISTAFMPFVNERRILTTISRRLHEVIGTEKPDLLHAHSPSLNALPALWVGKRWHLPVVYEIRAFWEDAAVDHGSYREDSWKYRLVRSSETFVCKRADHVTVLCQGLQRDLVERGIPAEKTSVVYNGIDPGNFQAVRPDYEFQREWNLCGKKVIAFLGSFYRYEGLDLLVSAMCQLKQEFPDAVLVLAGGGEVEAELKEMTSSLGLVDTVRFVGRVPHHRIPGIYQLADLLVYPRRAMRLTNLVTPLKPLEAMAMGKPLLASDVGGHRELIQSGKNGWLFPAGDLSGLVAAMRLLLSNRDLRLRLGSQGRDWVLREHTWERTTAPYEQAYGAVLARQRS
ncbi:MAG: TIGR04063 family PEP-CTERM/XrtA system glycosyltransferase [Acidobacteriota bacterium]